MAIATHQIRAMFYSYAGVVSLVLFGVLSEFCAYNTSSCVNRIKAIIAMYVLTAIFSLLGFAVAALNIGAIPEAAVGVLALGCNIAAGAFATSTRTPLGHYSITTLGWFAALFNLTGILMALFDDGAGAKAKGKTAGGAEAAAAYAPTKEGGAHMASA